MSRNEKIDLYLKKWISRKLTVFVVASVALFFSRVDSDNWTIVATMYIAVEGATNIAERLMKTKSNVTEQN
jgi:hypothetical protein